MKFTVQDIIDQKIFQGATIVAGKKAKKNPVEWVNVMEILDSPNSVQSGEILITTGYSLQHEDKHKNLIKILKARNVSALAIQTGYYIDTIPEYIIKDADEEGFPVLQLPTNLTFSEMLHTLIHKIYKSRNASKSTDNLLGFLEEIVIAKGTSMFNSKVDNYIFVFETINYSSLDLKALEGCINKIRSFLTSYSKECLFKEVEKGKVICVCSFLDSEKILSTLYELNVLLTNLSENYHCNIYAGVDKAEDEKSLPNNFKNAIEAISALRFIEARRGVCFYKHITFIKMFGAIHKKDSSVVLDNKELQIIMNYDKLNGANYTHTLRVYLCNNCNITHTAQQLFVHRHTLLKRIKKIESLTSINFDDYYERTYISVSLFFYDYFAF